jgi:cold shock CspA family protein
MTDSSPTAIREHDWGIIKTLSHRGFGFITAEGRKTDLFFHSRELQGIAFDECRVGDVLNFDIVEGEKGPAVVNVQRNGGPRRQEELQLITSDAPPSTTSTDSVEIASIKAITDAVIQHLSKNPDDLYRLHPKMFEELIAEIFMSEGYTTELIGSWNQPDGGVDIVAVRRDVGGFQVRYAIQCKRYAADRRITADPIRALAGVLDRFHAHIGVVATTSYFTTPAREEVEGHLWKINLRDYENIVAALKRWKFLRQ